LDDLAVGVGVGVVVLGATAESEPP